jgi:predicted lipoprotein with Yx(FWY)xxD motif
MRIGAMRWRAIGVGVALATLLSACGSDAETGVAEGSPTEDPGAEVSPTGAGGTVGVADTDLGSILVDAEGMTLYLFEADTDGTSTCYDECADAWPALIGDAPIAGEGIDETLLGTTERDDGEVQVTYAGRPLYYFASDAAAGDTEGQGIGDVWYVIDPSGEPITKKAKAGRGY